MTDYLRGRQPCTDRCSQGLTRRPNHLDAPGCRHSRTEPRRGRGDVAALRLRDLIPFDSSCWLSLDPSTLLPTSHFTRQLDSDHLMEIAENEFLQEDFNKFADLARALPPVGTLSHATEGDLTRSRRHRKVLGPHG
jgi:hypothetical protein